MQCRKANWKDNLAYNIADVSDNVLKNVLENREKKSSEQWNNRDWVIFLLGAGGVVGSAYAKYKINKDLCPPIGQ